MDDDARLDLVRDWLVRASRYPGGSFESMPSSTDFNEALQHAQDIYDFVLKNLPAGGHP